MLDYDREAGYYDESRGGTARAVAAADAIRRLLDGTDGLAGADWLAGADRLLVDIAGGTGSVTAELAGDGMDVLATDLSDGMLRIAARRLPGRVLRGDATRLPVRDRSVAAVTSIWLLHLLTAEQVARVISEVGRILRPGGRYITTVDKDGARHRGTTVPTDRREVVERLAAAEGLWTVGRTNFVGHGQGEGNQPDPVYTLLAFAR